ncbi:MAG: response regulator [Deltaproteobacteria bacterium]|nr:response regulator [Deltaproteobacteria bacterium]
MTTQSLRLLIVEDAEDDALLLVLELQNEGYATEFRRVETPEELKAALDDGPWDAVFADYNLPSFTGLDALRMVRERGVDLPFILVSGVMGEETAVEALKAGAHDYLMKGRYARLVPALERALRDAVLRRERRQTAEELTRHREHLEDLVQHRTEELAAANEELRVQTEELQAQREELTRSLEEIRRVDEERERLNADLAAANCELEAFNYTVSHDLRGPLNVISGYSQVIQELYGDKLDEECRGYLQEVCNGTQQMSQMISTLLKFSRLSHVGIGRERVDLSGMAQALATELRQRSPERGVLFRIAEGLTAEGDPNLLRIALKNLIGNAWKYTTRKEEAVIEFGTQTIAGETAFFVSDNGEGFDGAQAEKLFTPFQRLPGAEEFTGHGIGLATVRRIIQRHGGRVCAEGRPGEGATFYFTLPPRL